ncbi:MAG: GNAT family N-acetyltransferase [Rhodospirillaceae bacterium]|jgi:GNAT superfamily N-acetyltransferase|nr:GNAT family N-acetyltransferase [Rhodospirillaceae bacterium]MBT5243080.1 GNAT family N-acetyltransferase [Rhodospirillaceae bacterium]MBT5563305.1 GNAT family N-acetyltransferase [Rhodospirillaceae bacterium]MBT6243619.1 GNAT family N-acetyltransferase [Rhodospirillaceae bacterium]MBT7136449.1 GNAT family N-acetyltransferase [Rhodospirillaceae bacterium]
MGNTDITFRHAVDDDLPAIVALLADDDIGQQREDPSLPLAAPYLKVFETIKSDPNQNLIVVEDAGGNVIGTFQLFFLAGFARMGAWRGEIEAVRIAKQHRGSGLGQQMIEWAISQCRERDCKLVQLTMDKNRIDAHRFYEKLGFEASHEGFKLKL